MESEPVAKLSRALDATEAVILSVTDEQWGASTPCPDWNLRQLVGHLIGGNVTFASIVRGEPPARPGDLLRPDAELVSAYRESAKSLLGAFGRPGVLEQVFTIPFGSVPGIIALHLRVTEVLVHGWDVARATGQVCAFPEDLAAAELTFSRTALTRLPPDRRPFASSQPVADDAPAIDRLAACLGRIVPTHQAPIRNRS